MLSAGSEKMLDMAASGIWPTQTYLLSAQYFGREIPRPVSDAGRKQKMPYDRRRQKDQAHLASRQYNNSSANHLFRANLQSLSRFEHLQLI
jgi:hypothetical protein